MQAISQMIIDVENFPAGLQKSFPFASEGKVPSATLYKRNFEAVFQGPDLLANSTLGNIAEDGGLGEAARFNEIAEDFERFDLHGSGNNKID